MRPKTSKMWDFTKEYLQKIFDESSSVVQVLEKLGFPAYNGNHRTMNKVIKERGISLDKMRGNKRYKHNPSNIFERKSVKGWDLKEALIKSGIKLECSICKMGEEWQGKYLSLQVDHVDGNRENNNKSNLRLVCPNCHSQTDTFSGKKCKKIVIENFCKQCGIEIHKKSKLCRKCNSKLEKPSRRPPKSELMSIIEKKHGNLCAVGRHYNITDNSVRKWLSYYRTNPDKET